MKILLVSLDNRGFHHHLINETTKTLTQHGHTVVLLETMPPNWDRIKQVADKYKVELIHFARIVDTKPFYETVRDWNTKISFMMLGYSYVLRNPEREEAFLKLLELPQIHRVFISSIYPDSLNALFIERYGKIHDKITLMWDAPHDTKEFYRTVSKEEARKRLMIPENQRVALYFGTYFFSKGADLLLEVAKELPDIDFYMVGDTKLTSFDDDIKTHTQSDNVHWEDRYVSEEEARDYFCACDVVVLPYKHYYEHDGSGVLVKAMLAERLMVVPDIHPFSDIIFYYDVGLDFIVENKEDLMDALIVGFDGMSVSGFDKYLDDMSPLGWEVIGKNL